MTRPIWSGGKPLGVVGFPDKQGDVFEIWADCLVIFVIQRQEAPFARWNNSFRTARSVRSQEPLRDQLAPPVTGQKCSFSGLLHNPPASKSVVCSFPYFVSAVRPILQVLRTTAVWSHHQHLKRALCLTPQSVGLMPHAPATRCESRSLCKHIGRPSLAERKSLAPMTSSQPGGNTLVWFSRRRRRRSLRSTPPIRAGTMPAKNQTTRLEVVACRVLPRSGMRASIYRHPIAAMPSTIATANIPRTNQR
jgi:hypothetical protein